MVDRRRLVVVVVVHVQSRAHRAPRGDEVDELLERALLALPAERPDRRVPRASRRVQVGRVHHPEQVLQPELPAVLGVIPGALDVEEQVAGDRFGQREEPAVRIRVPLASRSGSSSLNRMIPSSSLATCSRAWARERSRESRFGRSVRCAARRSSWVSSWHARKFATSLAATRTRPSMIFIGPPCSTPVSLAAKARRRPRIGEFSAGRANVSAPGHVVGAPKRAQRAASLSAAVRAASAVRCRKPARS